VSGTNLTQLGPEVTGRKNVREQNGLLIAYFVRQLGQPHVGVGDAGTLRLQSLERSGLLRSTEKGGAALWSVGIGVIALRVVARPAVRAVAAGDRGRDDNPVADIEVAHVLAKFFNDAYAFVSQDRAGLDPR